MPLPGSRKDREYQKFVDDGAGNVAVRAVIIGGGGGGGFVNPMAHLTFLRSFDDMGNPINLIGAGAEAILLGDFVQGFGLIQGASDNQQTYVNTTTQSGLTHDVDIVQMTAGVPVRSLNSKADLFNKVFVRQFESTEADATALSYIDRNNIVGVANNDITHTYQRTSFNSSSSEFIQHQETHQLTNVGFTTESSRKTNSVMIGGTLTEYSRVDSNGITSSLLNRFKAVTVTGGISYAQFETDIGTGVYANRFGAGVTVPADAATGWIRGAQFTDTDATEFNRTWVNIGTNASASFRRMAYINNNGQLAFESGTAALPAFAFSTQTDKGMFDGGANILGLSTNGISRIQINSATNVNLGLQLNFSSGTAPNNTVTGLGRSASGLQLNVPTGSTHLLSVNGVKVLETGVNLLGFYGVTAVARATTAIGAAAFVANTSGIANNTATWGGYTLGQIVQVLINLGILTP